MSTVSVAIAGLSVVHLQLYIVGGGGSIISSLHRDPPPAAVGAICLIKGPGADLWLAAKANIRGTMQVLHSQINHATRLFVFACVCVFQMKV